MTRLWPLLALAVLSGAAFAQDDASPWYEEESTALSSPESGSATAAPPSEEAPASPVPSESGRAGTDAATIPVGDAEGTPAPRRTGATVLDVIEVTASKRAKSQRDLPGSVGAVRGEDLEQSLSQGMADYMKLVPGVLLTDWGTGRQIPVIRGITSNTGEPGTQFTANTTGIFLDDMPFADLYAPLSIPDLNPFDLERVEVLKGPQGTLFGSSALAGAIRYIPEKPQLSVWQGKLSTTVSQTRFSESPSRIGAGAINVPIGHSAAIRAVGVYRDAAGLYDATPNGDNTRDESDVDALKQVTGRILGRWDITPELKLSTLYFKQTSEQDDISRADNPTSPSRGDSPFPGPVRNSFAGLNLGASYDLPWARLLYSGNRLDKESYILSRQEPGLPTVFGNQEETAWYSLISGNVNGYTHELRVTSPDGEFGDWEWLGGVAFMRYRQYFFQFTPNPGAADSGYYANPPERANDVADGDKETSFLWATAQGDGTEEAVFGEVTRRMGEHWEATVGARAFRTELVSDTVLTGAQIVALGGEAESRNHMVATGDGINPKFALRYLHSENAQLYMLVARGFQFGGFQLNPPIANTEQATEAQGFRFGPYDSSTLWDYELGLRTEWLDRRLRFDLTAFYIDWTDLQLTIRVPLNAQPIPAPPGSGIPENVDIGVIVNVAAAHSEGLEAALEVIPFDGALVTSAAAWVSALTDEPFDEENNAGPVPAGTRLPGSPRFHWANTFSYTRELPYFPSWNGGISLTHAHIGTSPNALRATREVGGYDTLDAQLTLAQPGNEWIPDLSLTVSNLTDVRGISAYDGDGDAVNTFLFVRPRTTMLNLAWRY